MRSISRSKRALDRRARLAPARVRPRGRTAASSLARSARDGAAFVALFCLAALGAALAAPPSASAQTIGDPTTLDEDTLPLDSGFGVPPIEGAAGAVTANQPAALRFRSILASPRVAGRLTAVTVDARSPQHLYVGTEESTVLLSEDGGVTWEERELNPTAVADRTFTLAPPGPPRVDRPGLFGDFPITWSVDPPNSAFFDRIGIGFLTPGIEDFPNLTWWYQTTAPVYAPPTLLGDVVRARRFETSAVRRIAICPGSLYELLVVTRRELYGSDDGGRTFVRLFGLPGRTDLNQIECSPVNRGRIALGTDMGLFLSDDGGISFDLATVGFPGAPVFALAFGELHDGFEPVYIAHGGFVFVVDASLEGGFGYVYPDQGSSLLVPWGDVRWIDTSETGVIRLATSDGLRASYDGGKTWTHSGRNMLERQSIEQVMAGRAEDGQTRVVARTDTWVYASEEATAGFLPFFSGVTRRSFQQIDVYTPPESGESDWYLVTSGELFTTRAVRERPDGALPYEARWARSRLDSTPPLGDVIDAVLEGTHLDMGSLNAVLDGARARAYLPRVDVAFDLGWVTRDRFASAFPTTSGPFDVATRSRAPEWVIYAQLTFNLRDAALPPEHLPATRGPLLDLRRQVQFIAEDAWHERVTLLRRMAQGETTEEEALVQRARVESLEALLETWMQRPLSTSREGNTG